MVKVLRIKLFRDLYESRGLLLAITSIMTMGIMCYVAMQSAYKNLLYAKQTYYQQCRMADAWVDVKKAPVAEIRRLDQIDGIASYRDRIHFDATVDISGVTRPLNAQVLSLPDRRTPVINDILLRQGTYFTDSRSNEVILNDAFAAAHQIQPGDWIHVLLNNRRQELFVVGTAVSSEFTYLIGPGNLLPAPDLFGVMYIKRTFAEEVFDFQGAANQIVIRFVTGMVAEEDAILDRVETALDAHGVSAKTPLSEQVSNQFLSNEIDGLGSFATFMPTIFVVVAAVVLNVLMTRVARQQRTTVGTLKALGYSDWQVFAQIMLMGLAVGLLSGLLGSFLGYLCATGMTEVYRHYFEFPSLPSRFYLATHCGGYLLSVLFALLGSVSGARAILKLQPAAAMRPEPPMSGGKIWLEQLPRLWQLFDSGWRMALRSVVRNRMRSLTALFAATMGAAFLVTGFMMLETQFYLIRFQFQMLQSSDIDIVFESTRGREAVAEIASLPGVDYVEGQLNIGGTIRNGHLHRKVGIMGLSPAATLTSPRDTQGRPLDIPGSGLLLTKRLAEIMQLGPGDRLTFRPATGERRIVEMDVRQVADSYMGMAIYADRHYLAKAIGEGDVVTGVQITVDPDIEIQNQLYHELKNTPAIQSVNLRTEMIERLEETLLQNQFVFIGFLVGFAGIIFFGSIFNASIVNLVERQREVATFLAIGYSPWRVGYSFLRESLMTTIAGCVLGLPIGHGLMWLTVRSFDNDLMQLPIVQRPWIFVTTFILALAFAALAHAMVQWRIHAMDYLEALKVKE